MLSHSHTHTHSSSRGNPSWWLTNFEPGWLSCGLKTDKIDTRCMCVFLCERGHGRGTESEKERESERERERERAWQAYRGNLLGVWFTVWITYPSVCLFRHQDKRPETQRFTFSFQTRTQTHTHICTHTHFNLHNNHTHPPSPGTHVT